jgi:hypothetical protein
MTSIIKVDTIQDQDGNNIINENANTITIGASGDTITIPAGATIDASGATVTLPTTIEVDAVEPQSGTTLTLGASGDTITIPSGATIDLSSATQTGVGGTNTPLFYVYASAGNTSFTLNTNTKVTLDNESYDSGSFFDITTNYRFLPTIAGKYLFIGQALIDYTAGAPTTLNASIRLNNTSTIATSGYNSGSGYGARNMSGIVNMNGSTDYIELFVYSNSTTPYYTGGQYNTWLTGFKIIE